MNSDVPKKPVNRTFDHLFKLILVGDSCVGKTSILQRFHGESFTPIAIPTIGIDFRIRTINLQNKVIKLQIWDTSGQEKYDSITTSYYRGAMGIMVVYDITNRKSFDNIKLRWLRHISEYAKDGAIVMIIGNKCDLNNKREISEGKGEAFANEHGVKFFETSAKDNINLDTAFLEISQDILEKAEKNANNETDSGNRLTPNDAPKKRNYKCCQVTIGI